MCVSGVRSRVVSCECVRVSCEWASRRSSVVRREAFWFAPKFSIRVCVFVSSFRVEFRIQVPWIFVSYFEVEFRIRLFRFVALFDFSNFYLKSSSNSTSRISCRISCRNFRFEFRVQVPWIFDSSFEFKFLEFSCRTCRRIRLLEFRVEFQIRICRRNFSSKFSMSCSIRFLESHFEFVVEFDFSNFVALFDFSKSIVKFDFSKFDFSSQVPWISNASWSIRLLELSSKFVLLYSTSRSRILHLSSSSNFATFVARRLKSPTFVLNCKLTSPIILARALSLRSRCHASFARAFRA